MRLILNPREEIRDMLTRWPYYLLPDQAIRAAANASFDQLEQTWLVRIPSSPETIKVNVEKHTAS